MLAALEETTLLEISTNQNLTRYQLDETYTQLLDDSEIKAPKHVDFLALIQNFLALNDLDVKAVETNPRPSVEALVLRFVHIWGGADWGDLEAANVEPARTWTCECQRVTERVLGATLGLLSIRMQLDFPDHEKMIFFQNEEDAVIARPRSTNASPNILKQSSQNPQEPLSISQIASIFASRAEKAPVNANPIATNDAHAARTPVNTTTPSTIPSTSNPTVSRVSPLGTIVDAQPLPSFDYIQWAVTRELLANPHPTNRCVPSLPGLSYTQHQRGTECLCQTSCQASAPHTNPTHNLPSSVHIRFSFHASLWLSPMISTLEIERWIIILSE